MKKLFLIVIACIFLMTACAPFQTGSQAASPDQIRAEYEILLNEYEASDPENKEESGRRMASLMQKIADGDPSRQSEYAKLLRDILDDETLVFEDSQVFALADSCANAYTWLLDGNELGVHSISLGKDSAGKPALQIGYADASRYSVRHMAEDEVVPKGESFIPYDGALGKYRIEIHFGDTKHTEALQQQLPFWEVRTLSDTYKIQWCLNDSHGITIYVGSDTPFSITEVTNQDLLMPMDTLSIPLA